MQSCAFCPYADCQSDWPANSSAQSQQATCLHKQHVEQAHSGCVCAQRNGLGGRRHQSAKRPDQPIHRIQPACRRLYQVCPSPLCSSLNIWVLLALKTWPTLAAYNALKHIFQALCAPHCTCADSCKARSLLFRANIRVSNNHMLTMGGRVSCAPSCGLSVILVVWDWQVRVAARGVRSTAQRAPLSKYNVPYVLICSLLANAFWRHPPQAQRAPTSPPVLLVVHDGNCESRH